MLRCSALTLLIFTMAGCGGSGADVELTVPVNGVATYQGKPLKDYTIYFTNLANRPASAVIDEQGRFTLGTNGPGDGAPVGLHRVWLVFEKTNTGTAGQEDIDALPPKPDVELPAKYGAWETSELSVEVPPEGLADYKLELE